MKNCWQTIKRPIKVLAPMAGYTDSAFRALCRQFGADIVITELVSADAIYFQAKDWFREEGTLLSGETSPKPVWRSKKGYDPTLELINFLPEERPLIVQLFGKNPDHFVFAARWLSENMKPDGIDINMGCPARKVVASDHGAALLKDPKLAKEIVRQVVEGAGGTPVSVKTRLGWENDTEILEFAPLLAQAGISAIIIHGRTYKDGFKGLARWERIYDVKELLPELVVIGNGDIKSHAEIVARANPQILTPKYHLDGVAIGRAAFGKPYIFSKDAVRVDELLEIMRVHVDLVLKTKGERGIIELRKHLAAYSKGFSGAKELRRLAVSVKSESDVANLIQSMSRP